MWHWWRRARSVEGEISFAVYGNGGLGSFVDSFDWLVKGVEFVDENVSGARGGGAESLLMCEFWKAVVS